MPYRRPPLGAVLAKNKTEYPRAGAGEFLNKFRFNKLRIKVIMSFFLLDVTFRLGWRSCGLTPFWQRIFMLLCVCVFSLRQKGPYGHGHARNATLILAMFRRLCVCVFNRTFNRILASISLCCRRHTRARTLTTPRTVWRTVWRVSLEFEFAVCAADARTVDYILCDREYGLAVSQSPQL